MNEWLEHFVLGSYHLDLTSLEFYHGSHIYKGQGVLRWNASSGIEVEAVTDGMDALLEGLLVSPYASGQLLPDEHYMRMRATAQDGTSINIPRIEPSRHYINTNSPAVLWKVKPSDILSAVSLSSLRCDRSGKLEVLLSPLSLRTWPRSSRTIYESGAIRNVTSALDWLEFDAGGRCVARQVGEHVVHIQCDEAVNSDSGINAIRMAFAYLTGRMTNVIATCNDDGERVNGVIGRPSAEVRKQKFFPPLGDVTLGAQYYESFLSRMSDFFLRSKGQHFANLLYACMDSVDNSFTSHALVVCTMLEEMIMQTANVGKEQKAVSAEQRDQIEQALATIGIEAAVSRRILSAIDRMSAQGPKNVLHKWADDAFLGITKSDVAAWDDLRNKAAHGKFLMLETAKGQRMIDSLHKVANLVNKLILHASDYKGEMFDYERWDYRMFPIPEEPLETTTEHQ